MNTSTHNFKKPAALALASLLMASCSTGPARPDAIDNVRNKLTQLQSDSQLASRAPVEIQEAELAVRTAEEPQKDKQQEMHLVFMADRKVDIAQARAQARLSEDQRKTLSEQRQTARLDSRTQEADWARSDANTARADADIARQEADDLQRQIIELKAKATDRGLVVTLGDVLFDSGKSNLKGGATSNLDKLAAFLNKYTDRSVVIEGHTDSVGSENSNFSLSQRRADSVKSYLVSQGVGSGRIGAYGKGEVSPVSSNESPAGRQQNRRVEVIIENRVTMLK